MDFSDIPLIPREVLFANPDRTAVTISPHSSQLMWLGPLDGALNIWIAPRNDPASAHPLTQDSGRSIRSCLWTHDQDYILFAG